MSIKSEITSFYWILTSFACISLSIDAISIATCKISTSSTTHPTPERKRQWWSTPTPRGSYSSTGRPVVQDAWSVLGARSATTYSRTTICLSQRCSKQVSRRSITAAKRKEKGEKRISKIEKPKDVGHFLVQKQNFDFCTCPRHNVVKRNASGKKDI